MIVSLWGSPVFLSPVNKFIDKAAIIAVEDQINVDGSGANLWRLCTMQQVEEVKCLIRMFPIWVSSSMFYLATIPQQTYTVFQTLQSDRHLGKSNFEVPTASYTAFSWLSLAFWIPVYDRFVVPSLRKSKQSLENIRSIAMSFYYRSIAVGGYASGFMVSIVHQTTEGATTENWLPEDLNKGKLDYYYNMIIVIEIVNFVYFLVCARWYRYKGTGETIETDMETNGPEKPSL
ncbi:Proton-dependent oligopeptide transporter family [Macleaya cordata]|uniref:Proton-dependent oligopeptide transporter family n=1 Tax=Macleaya cordata TaxID=56857 RepID=A0A200Q1E6_MACCD|nr:Proton-dependent oligopeptide transporter family [Macleaya cordata]